MAVLPNCPNCGRELDPIAVPGGHPPWACNPCARAWWDAELERTARTSWDPLTRGHRSRDVLVDATTEQMAAEMRGTSVTVDTAHLLTDKQLEFLGGHKAVSHAFAEHLRQQLARRKPKGR